jgi:type I restriction enzyme M protein
MFVQTEKFLEAHKKDATAISVYGQELNERTWRMAKMNLAIHGLNANLGPIWADTFARDLHAQLTGRNGADFVMANPPFNIKDWARNESDPRWRYGVPPTGNANYAWIQHILSKLAQGGSGGVVMANGSMSTNSGGEGAIRAQIVEADIVSCMIALPTQLFRSTGIPVCVWFFAKDKSAGKQGSIDRTGQVLFIDARNLGYMVDRAERSLADSDIAEIANTFHAWRGTPSARKAGLEYENQLGFCHSATLAEIKVADYSLTPGRYVGAADVEKDGEPIQEKIERLTKELYEQFGESERLADRVREVLAGVIR